MRGRHCWRLPHWAVFNAISFDWTTSQRYTKFLSDTLPLLLDDVPLGVRRRMWFQHDGAPTHNAVNPRRHLNEVFGNRWIGRNGPVAWPCEISRSDTAGFLLMGAHENSGV